MKRLFLFLLPLLVLSIGRALAQDADDLFRRSLKTRFPAQTPSLPEIQINRALYQKDKVIPLLLKASPQPEKETVDGGDLLYYSTPDGKELDFYPNGAFSFLNPVLPGEKLLASSAEQAKTDANAFLADFGGLPEDAKLFDQGILQGGIGTVDTVLYYFEYSHNLHDIPVETDVIRIVGGGGRVVEFSFAWSAPVKETAAQTIKNSQDCYKSALKYYYQKLLVGKYYVSTTLTEVKLFYYFKNQKDFSTLVPVWRYTLTSPVGYQNAGRGGKSTEASSVLQLGQAVIRVNALSGDVIT